MRTAVALICFLLLGSAVICAGLAIGQQATGDDEQAVQRYLPDQRPDVEPYRPRDPERRRTIHAERIVLQGPNCRITLDATGRQPGICVESTKTRERVHLYLSPEGKAVIGVATPQRRELAVGLFAGEKRGLIQLADGHGIHVFTGNELARLRRDPWGTIGEKPKE